MACSRAMTARWPARCGRARIASSAPRRTAGKGLSKAGISTPAAASLSVWARKARVGLESVRHRFAIAHSPAKDGPGSKMRALSPGGGGETHGRCPINYNSLSDNIFRPMHGTPEIGRRRGETTPNYVTGDSGGLDSSRPPWDTNRHNRPSEEPTMPALQDAPSVFDRDFLTLRGKIIEMAATLDRIGRAAGSVEGDPRLEQVRKSLEVLARRESATDRAEQIQLVFSLPYDPSGGKNALSGQTRSQARRLNDDNRAGAAAK